MMSRNFLSFKTRLKYKKLKIISLQSIKLWLAFDSEKPLVAFNVIYNTEAQSCVEYDVRNKIDHVRYNVTLRHFGTTIVAVEKQ
jgi:hypothetical protein